MGSDGPKTCETSGESHSNSDSENSSTSGSSGSDWECSGTKPSNTNKPHFSVTSSDTGLKLKIAAIPRKTPKSKKPVRKKDDNASSKPSKERPNAKKKDQSSESSSSSGTCSKCTSESSSDDDIPLNTVSKSLSKGGAQKAKGSRSTASKSQSEDEQRACDGAASSGKEKQQKAPARRAPSEEAIKGSPAKRGRGRPRTKLTSPAVESGACESTTSSSSSSSTSSSSSSSSSSSDSDSRDAAGGGSVHASADDSSAALAAACQLQVIDDADLAELFPEQTSAAPTQPTFTTFAVNNPNTHNDKPIDNADESSSEMEITPQLVTAAIQRATADSSSSENENSNSDVIHQNTTHYASSLLQQFVAQTQMLSNAASMTPMSSANTPSMPCNLNETAPITDVLGQITNLQEMSTNFLSNQHLNQQQTEELSQINKDLEELSSATSSVGITIPNPPSLDDCVDNHDFMSLEMPHSSLSGTNDLLKSSPMTVTSQELTPVSQVDSNKLDTISMNSVESQEDVKNVTVEGKRKRGRPRKVRDDGMSNKSGQSHRENRSVANVVNNFHDNDPPNVSPDSGILSNHNSPNHSPLRRHDVDDSHSVSARRRTQKENSSIERTSRSKSKSRCKNVNRSDSSECDYSKKRIEHQTRQIKTETSSPVHLKQEPSRSEKPKKNDRKLDIAALDRMLYATDRVLYPPRKKVGRKPQSKAKPKAVPKSSEKSCYDSPESDDDSLSNNRSVLSTVYAKRKELTSRLGSMSKKNSKTFGNSWRDHQSENEAHANDPLDPTWKQIDLNPKYKDILSGYKSDHEFKPYKSCSRVIESGYKSDYGCRSGYKSDYYQKSGYKTDHKSGYKSDKSGYKTDCSTRSLRRRKKKFKKTRSVRDSSYYKNQKHFVSDQEIIALANKTFSSLNLGHSSSESECDSFLRKPSASPKYVSVSTKYASLSKYNYGFGKLNKRHQYRPNLSDPFAPGPVFSGLQRPVTTFNIFKVNPNNNNSLLKSPIKSGSLSKPVPLLKTAFTHKFGAAPIHETARALGRKDADRRLFPSSLSPKSKKLKTLTTKKDPKPLPSIFEMAQNSYVPSELISRNIFLNAKKPYLKTSIRSRKHRRTVVLAPPKINLKPNIPTVRPSRITVKTENRHHRHKSRHRHRSRSASRCRDTHYKSTETVDQKFNNEMDIISNFLKNCQLTPKTNVTTAPQSQPKVADKAERPEPAAVKAVKRGSKKRKTSDNLEVATPTSKRRHKKQQTESQNKSKDTNEHTLPLKKRHYHINSSTINSLSLSLVPSSEFDENKSQTSPEKFLCTESNCTGENSVGQSPRHKHNSSERHKKTTDSVKNSSHVSASPTHESKADLLKSTKICNTIQETLNIKIDENQNTPSKNLSPTSSNATDDELAIKKPSEEQSELSKKIYETSEKLKAVHKLVHDLEKSLPKSNDDTKSDKADTHKVASPKTDHKSSPQRTSAPIVTPKKRHRLEADKTANLSTLDQVVQSLAKKLSEDKSSSASKEDTKDKPISTDDSKSSDNGDVVKNMSARTLYKTSISSTQKSDIITRKKNRLEGLANSLVSKINPSAATKVLDTLLNNNLRKSIESRIVEKEKNADDKQVNSKTDEKTKAKEVSQANSRASVIKSPVPKGKSLEAKKLKTMEPMPTKSIVINEDKPTGIFEPSIDLEDQIPKSSICIGSLGETGRAKRGRGGDNKTVKPPSLSPDPESDIPLALINEAPINRSKRGESIASVLSDKLQETVGGHNLRQTKRNMSEDADINSDKKKKKTCNNILRESKLVLPPKMLIPKIQAERLQISETMKKPPIITEKPINKEDFVSKVKSKVSSPDESKKKPRRRKAINRTGFPSVKKKKKKVEPSLNVSDQLTSDTDHSAFERVPKDGEAMSTFMARTLNKKSELKVVLNKDECPKQARLTVVALEKLQGKEISEKTAESNTNKSSGSSILRAPALNLNQNKTDKENKIHVNKWEVLSETDSIPSIASSNENESEDSIPLSLLNAKADRSSNRLTSVERLKRKSRALSPSQEVEEILFSKKKVVDRKPTLRPKSSMAILCPGEKRTTRSSELVPDNNKDTKTKKTIDALNLDKPVEKQVIKPASVVARRKSRAKQTNKRPREVQSSSRESSIDLLAGHKIISREPSIDATYKDLDENEPLPLNEKEIDFEKSIDVLSKTVICKKRVASSRDESPASSVDQREKPTVSKKNPRLRKKFLVAGLFSDYYKEDPKSEGKGKNQVTQTEYPPGLLAPPPYCERWVRRRLQHFTLPYDIWWQHHYNQPVPSWNYKKIRTNVYYDVKPSAGDCESVACNCVPASGCPEDCINRLVYCECCPQLCPCGDKCKNQRIQRHEWASGLEKFMTVNKGWGVRTKHQITSGNFILEYVGEVVSDKEFKERMATRYVRDTHHYCLHLDGGLVIDGHRMGGDGRFVNHSCSPNCEMQKWTANGTFRMALFALRDIDPGEELTYDYNFSLFNPAVGQPCKCDSEDCRGVIGGKSQRITKLPVKNQSRAPTNAANQSQTPSRVGRPRKSSKCNKKSDQQDSSVCDLKNMTILKVQQHLNKLWQEPPVKPLTAKERTIVRDRQCFLFRNLERVRRSRDRPLPIPSTPTPPPSPSPMPQPTSPTSTIVDPLSLPDTMNPAILQKRIQALRAPKDEARKIVQLDDNQELSKEERLCKVFRLLYDAVVNLKDDKQEQICAPLLKRKPTKAKDADAEPILDLKTVDESLTKAAYENVASFDGDMNMIFSTALKEYGRLSALGSSVLQLRKAYNSAKADYAEALTNILGAEDPLPNGFVQKSKPEEVIVCLCGLHVEEGLMVACGACGAWQHARCLRLRDTSAPHLCHACASYEVDREIPLDEYTDEGHQFYLSLMRGDLQVRQGDTVYVLRDIPIDDKRPDVSHSNGEKSDSPKTKRMDRKKIKNIGKGKEKEDALSAKETEVRKHTYQTIGPISVSELDIFRVERLWKHKDTKERYVYGHHYLRPHETFHEPTRKFFPNEVMRVPLYEAVPIELVMSQCWVMDLNTYCKGRPVGASEPHVYICELRVDKTAHLFAKVAKPKYPICTKAYAFDHFPQRLKITRTYAPHEVLPEYLKGRAAKNNNNVEKEKTKPAANKEVKKKLPPPPSLPENPKTIRERQKDRVNGIARRLLAQGNGRSKMDASYLLDNRRRRRMS